MTHKLLATTLLAACMATTSLISVRAMANEPELYFYPKDKWTVERVSNGSTSNALQTCALSNQFNNGYIVQLAGSAQGFTNLNIDFRQDSFNENQRYEVKYSVPGIIEKVIPTKAFKKNMLVSDLRNDAKFAEALRTTSVLDVQIRDTKFRMYLTGLETALPEYTQCITPQATMAAAKTEDVPTVSIQRSQENISGNLAPPPPMLPLQDLAKNAAQQSDTDITDTPAHNLRPVPSSRPRVTEQLAKQLKEESEQYKPSIEPEALAHTENVSNILLSATAQSPSKAEIDNVANTHTTTEHSRSPKPIYHRTKLPSISVDLTNAAQQHKSNKSSTNITPPSITIASATTPLPNDEAAQIFAAIEPTSGTQNTDFIDMRNKISDLEKRIGSLLQKNKQLDNDLKVTLQDAQDERLSVSSENWNLERATMRFNESERQIMRMGRQLQTQKAQCQQEKSELENMLFDPELTNQQQLASLASLEGELDTVKSDFYRQQRQYEERIRLLEKQLNAQ
ncbi:MAG: hypothetical protein COA45_05415 [Zetaproteobacteria bacterium]|nr:MAG: hypothetical protein COA45_05415 [Zetaproteobacteria bacterium]